MIWLRRDLPDFPPSCSRYKESVPGDALLSACRSRPAGLGWCASCRGLLLTIKLTLMIVPSVLEIDWLLIASIHRQSQRLRPYLRPAAALWYSWRCLSEDLWNWLSWKEMAWKASKINKQTIKRLFFNTPVVRFSHILDVNTIKILTFTASKINWVCCWGSVTS